MRVDWLEPVIPMYAHILDRATEETWRNQPMRIASADGLILLKLIAFRGQDQADIENLVAANRDTPGPRLDPRRNGKPSRLWTIRACSVFSKGRSATA